MDISDSRFDLAWTLLLMSTHGDPEIRGLILREYKRLSGFVAGFVMTLSKVGR